MTESQRNKQTITQKNKNLTITGEGKQRMASLNSQRQAKVEYDKQKKLKQGLMLCYYFKKYLFIPHEKIRFKSLFIQREIE